MVQVERQTSEFLAGPGGDLRQRTCLTLWSCGKDELLIGLEAIRIAVIMTIGRCQILSQHFAERAVTIVAVPWNLPAGKVRERAIRIEQ